MRAEVSHAEVVDAFTQESLRVRVARLLKAVGAKTACIAPGCPWGNGYIERFNAHLRDDLLAGEILHTLKMLASS